MAEAMVQGDTTLSDSDRELAFRIRKVLHEYEPIRATKPPLEIDVREGRVHLRGRMRTLAMKEISEYMVMRLEGVRAVRNEVLTDPEVARAVVDALAADPELGPLCIQVDARYGEVVLAGRVPDGTRADRAMQLAATVHGVDNVTNRMRLAHRAAASPGEGAGGAEAAATSA